MNRNQATWPRSIPHSPSPPHRQHALLLLLVAGVLMMPVSYRAGTDSPHVHAIFQPMVDTLLGASHHHDHQRSDHVGPAPSPFSSPSIPLTAGAPLPHAEPDVPSQIQMATTALAVTAILGLGQLIATLLSGSSRRPFWIVAHHLSPTALWPEPPPPRQVAPS